MNPSREYKGFTIKLVPDPDPEGPEDWTDDEMYILHYHRQFTRFPEKLGGSPAPRTGPAYLEWLGEYHYEIPEAEREWYVFPLESYIHGGVVLAFESEGNFPDRRWDVSRCGSIVMRRKWYEATGTKQTPREVAETFLKQWNQLLEGDVWGYEITDAKGTNLTDDDEIDIVWGCYGEEAAYEQAEERIDAYIDEQRDKNDYSWVTDEMFDNALEEIVGEMSAGEILGTPGIREVLGEELNNAVLERLEGEREDA
jgi:hypothetical protein